MENEFPPNSHTQKEARPDRHREKPPSEKKEVVRVTKGKATLRKRPLYKQFIDTFRPEDNRGFFEYIVLEVFAQGIKDAIADASISGIENALGANRRRRRGGGSGYTSYNRMSSARPRRRRDRDDDDDRRPRRRDRDTHDDREIILESRVECEEVLDNMIEMISKYDVITKRDLLSMIGEHWEYTDEDWGWMDLRGARIHHIGRQGYLLDLPRPEFLD